MPGDGGWPAAFRTSGRTDGRGPTCDNRRMDFAELTAFAARHPILSLALAGLTLAIIGNEIANLFRGFKGIQPAGLTALVNRENALVVDLRPIGDFEKGH